MATITFNANGSVDISFGCNSGGGQYAVDGDTITFAQIIQTDMACGGTRDQVEQAMAAVLAGGGPVTFTLDASSLTLTSADGKGLMFTAQ
jgi:heat shock protein HslJ